MKDFFKDKIISKLNKKEAKICIIGLGYVGLPLMLRYAEVGFSVLGIDIDEDVVGKINEGQSYIEHIPSKRIDKLVKKHLIEASSDFSKINECDAIIICVPTPLNIHQEPNIEYIVTTIESISPYIEQGQIISLESTTYPGTTEEEIVSRVENKGFRIGEDYFVIYSPEREDPGNLNFDTSTIPKVCGGHTPNCLEVGIVLYQNAVTKVVPVSSTRAAEMTKLLENIYRAVNIGLVNEMKIVCHKMGIDIFEVIDAASTKPFGFTPFFPGPGLGGHCIPIDPFYLTWKAKEYGLHTRFIELSGEINRYMPKYVVEKVNEGLNQHGISLSKSKILVLGIAYKKNVDDMRESPSVQIMQLLSDKGADVQYSDPHVPKFPKMREHNFNLESIELSQKTISSFDAVILSTDHDKFDYALIHENANLIIDTRGKFRELSKSIINA